MTIALSADQRPEDTPRIYVACLASYNAGTLHGSRIWLDQEADELHAEIQDRRGIRPVTVPASVTVAVSVAQAASDAVSATVAASVSDPATDTALR